MPHGFGEFESIGLAMTLHDAMALVLREYGGWMDRDHLARVIAERDLYRQRAGSAAPSDQLRLRARKYPQMFEGSDSAFTRIRLRGTSATMPRVRANRPAHPSASRFLSVPQRGVPQRRRHANKAVGLGEQFTGAPDLEYSREADPIQATDQHCPHWAAKGCLQAYPL